MKKFWLLPLIVFFSWLFVMPAVKINAQDTQNFTITSFNAQYFLHRDAQKTSVMNVIETINAKFPDFDQNHGILRAIPKSYQDHTVSLSIESVSNSQNQPLHYETSSQNDNLVLKIGNADQYVHGAQTYVIRYTVRNVINFQPNQDEFYWDVNGDQWPQSINKVTATVQIDKAVADQLQERQLCYTGSYGSTDQTGCQITRGTDGADAVITAKTTRAVAPYQTLSFAIAFNQGTFTIGPEVARENHIRIAEIAAGAAASILPPLIAAGFMYRRWRQFGNDPKGRGVIIPQYEPPKGLNCLTSDFILQQKLRNVAITATIIELAIAGYLEISEVEIKKRLQPDSMDYSLKITKDIQNLPEGMKLIFDLIFGGTAVVGSQASLSLIKAQAKASKNFFEKIKFTEKWLSQEMFKKGYFIKDPKKVRKGYFAWAGGLFATK